MVGISDEELRKASKALGKELSEKTELLVQLNQEVKDVRKEAALVNELLALRESSKHEENKSLNGHKKIDATSTNATNDIHAYAAQIIQKPAYERKTSTDLEDAVENILRTQPLEDPMHIEQIVLALRDNGIRIPGQGGTSNVITRLRRSPDRFTRVDRGVYALKEWGLREMVVKRKRRRRR